ESGLDFDPEAFSKAGNATCPFCGTVVDSDYVKVEGCAGRLGEQLMAVAFARAGQDGKVYVSGNEMLPLLPDDNAILKRTNELCERTGLSTPDELISNDAKNA